MKLAREPEVSSAKLEQLETSLREDFARRARGARAVHGAAPPVAERDGFVKQLSAARIPTVRPFAAFSARGATALRRPAGAAKEPLFERDADSIGSAAMVPLGDGRESRLSRDRQP